eukprot:11828051-Alexandrium_andersonii.AAC.2
MDARKQVRLLLLTLLSMDLAPSAKASPTPSLEAGVADEAASEGAPSPATCFAPVFGIATGAGATLQDLAAQGGGECCGPFAGGRHPSNFCNESCAKRCAPILLSPQLPNRPAPSTQAT